MADAKRSLDQYIPRKDIRGVGRNAVSLLSYGESRPEPAGWLADVVCPGGRPTRVR
jgi:hypothetical protein